MNDVIASGTVFPPCNDGEAWPDLVLANLVTVVVIVAPNIHAALF